MLGYELEVAVTQGDDRDEPGVSRLSFRRVYDPHFTEVNVERLTDDGLRATRDAINAYLGDA